MKEEYKSIKVDFTNSFTMTEFSENIYITLPLRYGHETPKRMDLGLKLDKSFYGLFQAPRCLFQKLYSELRQLGLSLKICINVYFTKKTRQH